MAKNLSPKLKHPLAELPRERKNKFSKIATVEMISGYSRKEL